MLSYRQVDQVAQLHLDDGKANALSEAFSAAVNEGLDRAEIEPGFLDAVCSAEALLERAQSTAAALAALPGEAYATSKRRLRSAAARALEASLPRTAGHP